MKMNSMGSAQFRRFLPGLQNTSFIACRHNRNKNRFVFGLKE